jgi:hypothetical protein
MSEAGAVLAPAFCFFATAVFRVVEDECVIGRCR